MCVVMMRLLLILVMMVMMGLWRCMNGWRFEGVLLNMKRRWGWGWGWCNGRGGRVVVMMCWGWGRGVLGGFV